MDKRVTRHLGLIGLCLAVGACGNSSDLRSSAPAIDPDGYCAEMQVSFEPAEEAVVTDVAGIAQTMVLRRNDPPLTAYRPAGIAARSLEEATNPVLMSNDRFYTLHGGVRSADEVDVAYPPVFEHVWTAEPGLFLPEGQVFGDGTLYAASAYFFPGSSVDLSLVSLDMQTGARRWKVVPGQTGQTGAMLILRDPDSGGNVVYAGGARAVFALDEAGAIRWCRNTGVDVDPDPFANEELVHMFGINYHVATDTVVAVFASGEVIAFDRRSGRIAGRIRMPGAPAAPAGSVDVPAILYEGAERAFRARFVPPGYPLPEDYRFVDTLVNAILGGGIRISNYFATDPDSDLLWVASTMEDEADGTVDGIAEFGALYGLRLRRADDPDDGFAIHCRIPFDGGSASTPAVSPGGERVYTSDAFGKVLAFDRDCRQLWATDLGQQVIGSLALSSTDGEIYAATGQNVFKLQDRGDSGPVIWASKAEQAFAGGEQLLPLIIGLANALESLGVPLPVSPRANNLNITGIGENGVMVQSGFGLQASADNSLAFLPVAMSMTLLDRETGEVMGAAAAQEETVAVISTAQDGALYIGNSPIRRAFLRGLLEPGEGGIVPAPLDPLTSALVPGLIGGVSKYAPQSGYRHLARDASCFAQRRLQTWVRDAAQVPIGFAVSAERAAALNLARQALDNADLAFAAGEFSVAQREAVASALAEAGLKIADDDAAAAVQAFGDACASAG